MFGASLDSVADQAAFYEKEGLNFPLLSDPDGSAARKYGVLGEGAKWTQRVTFLIDKKGFLRAIDDEVQVASHGADLVERVKALQD